MIARINRWMKFHLLAGGQKNSVWGFPYPVSYTHLRAHETVLDLVCRLLLEKKHKEKKKKYTRTLPATISIELQCT